MSTQTSAPEEEKPKSIPASLKELVDLLREEFKKSALVLNAVFGLILTGLEKGIEVQFACPCDKSNLFYALAFLVCPGFLASMLMLVIQGYGKCCKKEEFLNLLLFGLVPAIMWLILILMDGQYFVCAKTTWEGKFVIIDTADPRRWCEPDNTNSTSYNERLSNTRDCYFKSQGAGLIIILFCSLLLIGYGVLKRMGIGNQAANQHKDVENIALLNIQTLAVTQYMKTNELMN